MDRQALCVALVIAVVAPVVWWLGLPMWFVWTLVVMSAVGMVLAVKRESAE